MEFIEGRPKLEGRDCIMGVVDRFTKYGHFMGLVHPYTTQEVAKMFLDQVKLRRTPKAIVSDRDKIFTSLLWKELMGLLGVKLKMSSAYHPESNGQTKRVTVFRDVSQVHLFPSTKDMAQMASDGSMVVQFQPPFSHKNVPF